MSEKQIGNHMYARRGRDPGGIVAQRHVGQSAPIHRTRHPRGSQERASWERLAARTAVT